MTALAVGDLTFIPSLLTFDRRERKDIFYLKTDIAVTDALLRTLADTAASELEARLGSVATLASEHGFEGAVSALAVGTYHLVHRVDRAAGAPLVVRSTIADLFVEDRGLLIEGRVRTWLANAAAASLVPETYTTGMRSVGAPFDFAIMAFAKGVRLKDLGDAVLDEEDAYLSAIGSTLRLVHAVEGRGAGLLDCDLHISAEHPVGVHDRWANYIFLHLEDHIQACVDAGCIDHPIATRILHLFEMASSAFENRPMRLLHGDAGTHNLCVDPTSKQATSLIDWEDALVGDPLFDVAMVSTFQPARRMPAFMGGYGLDRPSREEKRLIALYFLRIALSKTVHRIRFAVQDLPGRTPGHHRIRRGVDEFERLL